MIKKNSVDRSPVIQKRAILTSNVGSTIQMSSWNELRNEASVEHHRKTRKEKSQSTHTDKIFAYFFLSHFGADIFRAL